MDETLKQKLAEYLGHLEAAAKAGGDFAAKEIPAVLREMVIYEGAMAAFWVVAALALAVAAAVGTPRLWKMTEAMGSYDRDVPRIIIIIGAIAAGVASLIVVCVNTATLLQCWLAPRYFVLQQVASLLKSP